jgi:hypothetical protein
MRILTKLWWGQYSLVRTFWGFYVLGYIGWALFWRLLLLRLSPIAFAISISVWAFYWIVVSVGVWRSADAYPLTRWWPVMAKIVVIIFSGQMIWILANGGALNVMNRIVASN